MDHDGDSCLAMFSDQEGVGYDDVWLLIPICVILRHDIDWLSGVPFKFAEMSITGKG